MQTLQQKYIDQLYLDRKVSHLSGWKFVCPFCSHIQKSDSRRNEKCATLLDVYDSGGYAYTFHCRRGINNRTFYSGCSYSMSFTQFLRSLNSALCDQYLKEKNECEIRRRRNKIPKDFSDGKYPNCLNQSPATSRKDLVEEH